MIYDNRRESVTPSVFTKVQKIRKVSTYKDRTKSYLVIEDFH